MLHCAPAPEQVAFNSSGSWQVPPWQYRPRAHWLPPALFVVHAWPALRAAVQAPLTQTKPDWQSRKVSHAAPAPPRSTQVPQNDVATCWQYALAHCAESMQPAPFARVPAVGWQAAGPPVKGASRNAWHPAPASALPQACCPAGVQVVSGSDTTSEHRRAYRVSHAATEP